MDLHDFCADDVIYNEKLNDAVQVLLDEAAAACAAECAEQPLLRAYFLQPDSLTVTLALYRLYYAEARYGEALTAAETTLRLLSRRLNLPLAWRDLSVHVLGYGVLQSMTLVRCYLLALKGAGYLNVLLDNLEEGIHMLEKVLELDAGDRLGVAELLRRLQEQDEARFSPAGAVGGDRC